MKNTNSLPLNKKEAISANFHSQSKANRNCTYSFEIDSARQKQNQEPNLPQFNSGNLNSDRHISQLALQTNLVPKNYTDITTCQTELENIIQQIQELYQEGPIVNGWLESHPPKSESTSVKCDRSDTQLIEYVEEVSDFHRKVTCESPRPGYYLCGRDAAGKKLLIPCPIAELASVSMAIARYQKLQQLLKFKHYLEICIKKLS